MTYFPKSTKKATTLFSAFLGIVAMIFIFDRVVASVLVNIGNKYMLAGITNENLLENKKAIEFFEKVEDFDHDENQLTRNIAQTFFNLGLYQQVINTFDRQQKNSALDLISATIKAGGYSLGCSG